ncbi:MAG: SDR family NAD(P)-dependent oxidoreductase [Myxococcales bacterium]|nr:SDR family NAD(P)-dependent oxidoreductase [Myxococcales bacterium]
MRRILVTGANKGIGAAIVRAILDEYDDTMALLACRDRGRGEAAVAALVSERPAWRERLMLVELDVGSDASVSAAAATVGGALGSSPTPLYALVNNAGIGLGSNDVASVLNVNLLGPRRVCEAFVPLLDPERGRVVHISSASGPNFVNRCSPERQRFFVDPELQWSALEALIDECTKLGATPEAYAAAGLGSSDAYGLSKACLNSYTMLLAREHPTLRINACTPGYIETDLTRPHASGTSPAALGMKPPSAGARAAMFLLFGQPDGSGHYYGSDAVRSPLDRYRAPGDPPFLG